MEKDKKKGFMSKIPIPLLFIVSILTITYFCPKENKFKYSYVEGKPWRYGLLTASFDFPVYKPDTQIERERDSILSVYQPYYKLNKQTIRQVISRLEEDAIDQEVPGQYVSYVKSKLNDLYDVGVISAEDYEKIEKTKSRQLQLINNNIATSRNVTEFYTSKLVYEELLKDIPSSLEPAILKSLNFDNYLYSNIIYDNETSNKVRDELLAQVAPAQGVVQTGEKIIDRGEIVTERIYNVLTSLERATEERAGTKMQQGWLIFGEFLLVAVLMMAFMTYLIFFRPREYANRKDTIFMLLMITIFCVLTGITVDYSLFNVYIIPFAIPTILVRTFIDSRTAMTTHMVMCLICSFMVPFPAEFLLLQIPVGFMCIFSLKDLSERSQLIKSSFFILLAYIVVYVGYVLAQEGDIRYINWHMFLYFGINFIFVMFSYLLVYMCEKVFGFISGVSMVELSNTNKPLLQKLSEVAPGTFQHSMQVSNLAAAVATRLGANAALVRTGALYHDIGKMTNAAFFTENQAPGMNPHANLSFKESARIIIGHVEEGIKLAHKYNLPQQIIDFIATHHGEGKAKFFYNSYKNEHPDEDVNESDFSYKGPNPFSKETAILMMADTVEAASRSLKVYNEETISTLVNKLVNEQVSDGLLRNAPITFKDIELAKTIFCEKLMTIYHTRVTYPELREDVTT